MAAIQSHSLKQIFELYFATLQHKSIREKKKTKYKFKVFLTGTSCKKSVL